MQDMGRASWSALSKLVRALMAGAASCAGSSWHYEITQKSSEFVLIFFFFNIIIIMYIKLFINKICQK